MPKKIEDLEQEMHSLKLKLNRNKKCSCSSYRPKRAFTPVVHQSTGDGCESEVISAGTTVTIDIEADHIKVMLR